MATTTDAPPPFLPEPSPSGSGDGTEDFIKQIEGTWKQIKAKGEELKKAQAENARLLSLLDNATGEISRATAESQKTK